MLESTYLCPLCNKKLLPTPTELGLFYICDNCKGRFVSIYVLKKYNSQFVKTLWKDVIEPKSNSIDCSFCGRKMNTAYLAQETQSYNICKSCQVLWFNPGEFEEFMITIPQKTASGLSPEIEKEISQVHAKLEFEEMIRNEKESIMIDLNDLSYREIAIAALELPAIGLPLEDDKEPQTNNQQNKPWATYFLSAMIILVFAMTYAFGTERVFIDWGFIPNQWYRYYGLTILTSCFLYAGIAHFIVNLYFLIIFGDNVELYLGRRKYLVLFISSHLLGTLLGYLANMNSGIPCVGASAGISCLLAFYTVMFSKNKVKVPVKYLGNINIFKISITKYFVLWIIFNIILLFYQTNINAIAHLGGAVLGLIYALNMKPRQTL